MGTPLATAFVRIRPQTDGFQKDTERQLDGDLDKAGTSLGKTLGKSLAKALGDALENAAAGMGKSVADEFAEAFTERVKERTKDAPLGPPKTRTRKQGEESAGTFADGFKRQLQQASKALPPLNVGVAKTAAEQQLRDLQAQLRDLAGKTIGVDVDASAALAQVRGLQGQLSNLAANSPDIQVRADTAAALAQLAKVTAAADKLDGDRVEVEVDVDTDRASRGVSSFAGGLTGMLGKAFQGVSSTASTFFQTLSEGAVRSGGQIASSLASSATATAGMTGATGGLNLVLGALVTTILAAAAATVGLTVGFVALAPVLLAAGGLLGGFVTLLTGGAAAAAVFKFGLGGVGDAFTAMGAAQDEATQSSASFAGAQNAIRNAADQVRSALAAQKNTQATVAEAAKRAAQQIVDAERAVGQARRDAARAAQDAQQRVSDAAQRVRDAQRALTDAEKDALQVREDLTRAQQDAKRNLEDLASAVRNNSLDQQQSVLDVAEAQRELQKVMADPKATAEQKRQAQLTYERQVQQLQDLQLRGRRLAEEQADANKKGVNGSDQVVDARKRIADADERIAEARRGVSDAQTQLRRAERDADDARLAGQQKVAQAERALADARAAQTSQQRQGAYQLAQASQAVASAQRAVQQASMQAGTAGGSALKKLNQQMAELSPNARELVRTLFALRGPFGELRKFVQDRLLEGVAGQVRDLAGKWLPALKPMLGGLADDFNKVGDGLFKALGQQTFIDNIKTAVAGFGDMVERIGKSLPGLFDALGRVAAASTPVLREVGNLVGGIFDRFSAWIRSADNSGKLDTFMKDAAATLRQIFSIGGLVVRIAGEIFRIFFPQSQQAGDGFLGGVEKVLKNVLGWLQDPKNQEAIREWTRKIIDFVVFLVGTAIPQFKSFTSTLFGWGEAIGGWVASVARFGGSLKSGFMDAVRAVGAGWATLRDRVFTPLKTAVTVTIPNAFRDARDRMSARFGEARDRVAGVWQRIRDSTFTPLRNAIMTGLPNAFRDGRDRLAARFSEARDRIAGVWQKIRDNVFTPLRNAITTGVPGAFRAGVDAIGKAWDKVKAAAKTPVSFVVKSVVNPLIGGINKVGSFVGIDKKIPTITGFARGGQIPGKPSVRDNLLATVKGTGAKLAVASGEFITNTKSTMANLGLVKAINAKQGKVTHEDVDPYLDGRARGGQVGDGIGDFFGKLWKGAKGAADAVLNPKDTLLKVARSAMDRIPGGGQIIALLKGMGEHLIKGVGGFLGDKLGGGAIGNAGVAGGWKGMQRLIAAKFPDLRLVSGFRPGARTVTGNRSYHGMGRAVDYPPVRALAAWIKSTYGAKTKELITPWQDLNLHNGKPHHYTGRVWDTHNFAGGNAHVHWAAALGGLVGNKSGILPFGSYDSGGYLPTGLSLAHNGTGRPEPVGHHLGGNTYNITVSVPVGAHPAQVGKEIVAAIKAYESGSGTTWRK